MTGESFGAQTALSRRRLSAPMRLWKARGWLKGDVLDFGCGRDPIDGVARYDAFVRPDPKPLLRTWDVVTCNYVLNVQPSDHLVVQIALLLGKLITPDGVILLATISDRSSGWSAACGGRPFKTRGEWEALLNPVLRLERVSGPSFFAWRVSPRTEPG